jgi:hypothetical protein
VGLEVGCDEIDGDSVGSGVGTEVGVEVGCDEIDGDSVGSGVGKDGRAACGGGE